MKTLHPYEEAFLPIYQKNFELVQEYTFGHLAPKRNKIYKGELLFAVSEYNSEGTVLIKDDFKELENSPWQFEAMQEFINSMELDAGFYKFEGQLKNYKLTGLVTKINA